MTPFASPRTQERSLLGRRFDHDGSPVLPLNDLQRAMKEQVDRKVDQGTYCFEHTACHICGGTQATTLATKDRYGVWMPVMLCETCGLIYTNPRMTQEAYAHFYNDEYRKLYGGVTTPTDSFFEAQREHGKKIFSYLSKQGLFPKPPEELSVLEVGCGAGGILQYFQERGCRVTGIDLGEEYVRFGRDRHGLALSVCPLAEAPRREPPDLVIYSHVLEHILTPNQELETIRRILSPDGLLYIELPGVKNLMNSYRMDFLRYLQNAHTYHFTLTTLENLLRKNHFQIIVGDEMIRSVFRTSSTPLAPRSFTNDYAAVLAYLRRVERLRARLPFPPYVLKQPRLVLPRILKRLGLVDT